MPRFSREPVDFSASIRDMAPPSRNSPVAVPSGPMTTSELGPTSRPCSSPARSIATVLPQPVWKSQAIM